jgi:hypothetical protein
MSSISGAFGDDSESLVGSTALPDNMAIKMDQFGAATTTQKTSSLEMPSIPATGDIPLSGRVTEGRPLTFAELIKSVLRDQPNYLDEIRTCVANYMALLTRSNALDRKQIDRMKTEYEQAYLTSAGLTRKIARDGLIFSGVALLPALLFLSPNGFDREMGGLFAREVCPKFGEMWNSAAHSDMKKADSLASLVIQEYSAKTAKSSSEANARQEITALLDKILSALKEAARTG